ncbi:MAG TPA: response regulator [Polyangiaceae bacterium]|nr:response regulator [Polyangiaceae bacterium]
MKAARVLLVEDNPIMCRFVCSALESDDMRVVEAHSGAQALGLWAQGASDVVLQDTALPDIDGFDLVTRLRHLPGGADVPIVALSGLLSESDAARISAVGFSDVITKPLDVSRLRQVVRAHLPQRASMPPGFGEGRQVLIVDDDPVQAKLLAFRLSRLGFQTLCACDGLEGLELARQTLPDAIVSDIMMPMLDGYGLCAAVRKDAKLASTPLVLMTNSYLQEPDRKLARSAGADSFVIRTPGLAEVVDALHSSLSHRSKARLVSATSGEKLEKVWTRRVVSQLERQIALNAGMARRSATLSAELAVLGGISEALASRRDTRTALADVVAACVDASGCSHGLLHVTAGEAPELLLSFGAWDGWNDTALRSLLAAANQALGEASATALSITTPEGLGRLSPRLGEAQVAGAALVRITRGGTPFGTLLLASKVASTTQEALAFLEAVGTQIAQALALTRAFAEKEASEQRARQQAAVLRSVLDTVAEGVVVTDARGDFLLCNPAAERILGTEAAHVPAQEWPDRLGLCFAESMSPVAPDEVPPVLALSGRVVDDRQSFQLDGGADSDGRQVTISARPLEKDGAVSGVVTVVRDITEERSTQTRLLVADRMASIGMLAAGVAHEINNPLAAVLANLELATDQLARILRGGSPPTEAFEIGRMLGEAREAGERVRRIVRDLRTLSRAEGDPTGVVDIHQVLESALRLAKNEISQRAQVAREYADDARYVLGNEPRLGQVFLNLVMNAVQALPEGRAEEHEIRIRTRLDPRGRVVVTVADTGAGISPESMKRLFVPFFTTKAVGLGTGLGLSICQRLVTACGGEISADSRPGAGATFHVALMPAAPAPEAQPEPAPATPPRAAQRGKILMVDDEPVILSILSRALGSSHDCVSTTRATDALERLRAGERFDLILCDLMMPGMDGRQLFDEVARLDAEQARRVMFLSGGAFTPALQAFLAGVPNERISKPFDVAALKATVNARLA